MGTWLDDVCYINRHWISLKQLRAKIKHSESSAAAKVCRDMEKPEIIGSMGFWSAFEFFVGYIKESEASKFSVVKANVHLEKISEKLIDLTEAGKKFAEILLNKLQDLTVKYSGLTTAARMARGEGVSEPQQLTIYSFDRCTSVSVESLSFRF